MDENTQIDINLVLKGLREIIGDQAQQIAVLKSLLAGDQNASKEVDEEN